MKGNKVIFDTKLWLVSYDKSWENIFCRQISNKAGLKKLFVCRHSIQGLQVGSVGLDFFFIFVVSLAPILVANHF